MSSNRERAGPKDQQEDQPSSKTTSIEGGANIVGNRNNSQNVVVHIHQGGGQQDALTDSERELLSHFRRTSPQGRLAIQHVAVLASSRRPKTLK